MLIHHPASPAVVYVVLLTPLPLVAPSALTQHILTPRQAQLAKTLGVVKLVVVVNKLDDHSVVLPDGQWDQNRCVCLTLS